MIGRHVLALGVALLLFSAGAFVARWFAVSLEDQTILALAPRMFDLKNQGSELQDAAFRNPDLLVVYGSSELEQPNPFHASEVFKSRPTGFTIFPIGRGQTTSLIMLQDLAAVGHDLHGKKVVLSLSPSWFFLHDRTPDFYGRNASLRHLSALVFSTDLSDDTKQRAVRQLMQSPDLFKDDNLLRFAAQRLAEDGPLSHLQYLAVFPLGLIHNAFLDMQDLWATYRYIHSTHLDTPPPAAPRALDWTQLTQTAEQQQIASANNNDLGFDNSIWIQKYAKLTDQRRGQFNDAWFIDNLDHNAEFTDLDILLSGLRDLGADPLLIAQPIPGKYYDTIGISAAARSQYYARLREVAARHDVPVVDFEDHDNDIYFVTDPNSHLSRKGWAYYDRALDAFYHDNLPQLALSDWSASAVLPGNSARFAPLVR